MTESNWRTPPASTKRALPYSAIALKDEVADGAGSLGCTVAWVEGVASAGAGPSVVAAPPPVPLAEPPPSVAG